jgi:hypothetical protein
MEVMGVVLVAALAIGAIAEARSAFFEWLGRVA